jgi:hypothetical protein
MTLDRQLAITACLVGAYISARSESWHAAACFVAGSACIALWLRGRLKP